jgi:hypothetical protein
MEKKGQRQLVIGKVYTFDELTDEEQQDVYGNAPEDIERDENTGKADPYAWNQFLSDIETQYKFVLESLTPEQLLDYYGDDIETLKQDNTVNRLIEDIKMNGMKNIPVGEEGHHRAGAHILMGIPMLHFEIIR